MSSRSQPDWTSSFLLSCRFTAKNGVVLATEKKTPSPLVDDSSLEKVAMICPNIGFVYAGMGPDYRVLVAKARKIAQSYWKVYGEYPPVKVLVADVAAVMQKATQSGYVAQRYLGGIASCY